jgi:hypothetical protein
MGLGGTTPVPRLILGNLWYVLIYDRFAVWASLLYSIFLGIMLKDAGQLVRKYVSSKRLSNPLRIDDRKAKTIFILGLAASSVFSLSFDSYLTPHPFPDSVIIKAADFLEQNRDYRYITFGLNQGALKLSIICSAETIDGGYNSARRISVLVSSGVERIDNAIYFPNSTYFLNALLSQSADLGIKWILVNGNLDNQHYEFYTQKLSNNGYTFFKNETDGYSTIQIWQYDSNIEVENLNQEDSFNSLQIIMWSLGSLSLLFASLLLCALDQIKKKHEA